MSKCLYCGAEITEKSHNVNCTRKFCNRDCYRSYHGITPKQYGTSTCLYCGKEFQETRDRPNLFCSKRCAAIYRGVTNALERSERNEVNPETLELLKKAQEEVERLAYVLNHEKRCSYCGTWFFPRGTRCYCSDQCASRADNQKRDSRLTRNGKADYSITLPRVYDRCGGICQMCGKQLTFNCDPNSDDYPSIDHIRPISKGGLHVWTNVQLLCRRCNTQKGAKFG